MIVLIVCLWNIGIPVLILIIFFIQESGLITQTVKIIPLVQIKHHLYRIIMCAQIRRIMPFRLQNLFHLLTDSPHKHFCPAGVSGQAESRPVS